MSLKIQLSSVDKSLKRRLPMSQDRLIIRIYNDSDAGEVVHLWNECGLITPDNDPMEDIKLKINFQRELFFTGLYNSKIASTLMAGYDGHRGWFNYFGVLPEFQGKGFGKQIANHAAAVLKKMGCPKINLQVRNTNISVIEFYKEIGFTDHDVTSLQMEL
jgi:ribosomal protein S18 acetylase RimI-like enzyme